MIFTHLPINVKKRSRNWKKKEIKKVNPKVNFVIDLKEMIPNYTSRKISESLIISLGVALAGSWSLWRKIYVFNRMNASAGFLTFDEMMNGEQGWIKKSIDLISPF